MEEIVKRIAKISQEIKKNKVDSIQLLIADLTEKLPELMYANQNNMEFQNQCIEVLNDMTSAIQNEDLFLLYDILTNALVKAFQGEVLAQQQKQEPDKNYFIENIKKIREFNCSWEEIIISTNDFEDEEMRVRAKTARTGETIFSVETKNRELYLNGKYNPEKASLDFLTEIDKKTKIVFLIGLGNLSVLRNIIKKYKDVFVVVYEPSLNIFINLIKNTDITDLITNKRVGFVVNGINKEEFTNILNSVIVVENYTLIQVLISPNYENVCEEETKWAIEQIKGRINQITVWWNTTRYFQDINEINVIQNIKYLKSDYTLNRLDGICNENIPCIVVAAGPSLNKNIAELKAAEGHACIIACDTALKPLKQAGIKPDFFLIVDPRKPESLFDFDFIQDIPAVIPFGVPNYILKKHKGKKFLYWDGDDFIYNAFVYAKDIEHKSISFEQSLGILPTGGSVATSAFAFACGLGAKTIILVGQDLAYTNDRTHADGTFNKKMEQVDTSGDGYIEVESISGGKVKTIYNLKMYLEWFEKQIKANPEIEVIDATEGGALIHGSHIMTLKQAIEERCISDWKCQGVLDELPKLFNDEECRRLDEYLMQIYNSIETVQQRIKEGLLYYNKLLSLSEKHDIGTQKAKKILKKIKKINNYLDTNEVALLATGCLQDIEYCIRTGMASYQDTIQEELHEVAQSGISYLHKLQGMVNLLKPVLEENFKI